LNSFAKAIILAYASNKCSIEMNSSENSLASVSTHLDAYPGCAPDRQNYRCLKLGLTLDELFSAIA